MNLSDAAVGQVMIPVDDFERGVAFYRDVLGIPFLFATPPMMAFFKSWGRASTRGDAAAGAEGTAWLGDLFSGPRHTRCSRDAQRECVTFLANPHVVDRTPKSELWLPEFTDPDGNPLALMSEVALAGA